MPSGGKALTSYTDHDDRAAIVCALTAFCVKADVAPAAGDAVGREDPSGHFALSTFPIAARLAR